MLFYQNPNILSLDEYQQIKSFLFQNIEYFDLSKIKQISFWCYRYEDYIIKIKEGLLPVAHTFKNDFFVKTFATHQFKFKNINMYIEINEYLRETENVSFSDLFYIYSSLRKQGIIWNDVSYSNVIKCGDSIKIIDLEYIYDKENYDKNTCKVESDLSKECANLYELLNGNLYYMNKKRL